MRKGEELGHDKRIGPLFVKIEADESFEFIPRVHVLFD